MDRAKPAATPNCDLCETSPDRDSGFLDRVAGCRQILIDNDGSSAILAQDGDVDGARSCATATVSPMLEERMDPGGQVGAIVFHAKDAIEQ